MAKTNQVNTQGRSPQSPASSNGHSAQIRALKQAPLRFAQRKQGFDPALGYKTASPRVAFLPTFEHLGTHARRSRFELWAASGPQLPLHRGLARIAPGIRIPLR